MALSSYLDAALLHAQLAALSVIGTQLTVPGRTRLALSDADRLARDQLVAWMRAVDLTVHIDAVGNIYGILEPDPACAHLPVFLIGSHIDTVIEAGAYDGCYGVVAGLAVLRALRSAGVTPPRPVGVVAFSNEEGVRFQPDMLGSLTVAGGISVADVLDLVSTDGACYGDELVRIGYAGPMMPGSLPIHAYLELHIEQGPILAATGVSLGAIHTLQGISWQRITLSVHDSGVDISDEHRASGMSEIRWEALRGRLSSMLDRLDRREKLIVRARFSLGGHRRVQTLQKLADRLGVSKERIRQLEKRALDKLRDMADVSPIPESDL